MKFERIFLVSIFILTVLTIGAVCASDNLTDCGALDAVDEVSLEIENSSDVLNEESYYDGDIYIYVHENYTQARRDWDSYDLVYIASYSQKNSTIDILVDGVEKQHIDVTNGCFSTEKDENGTEYGIYYKNVYPNDLGLDCGLHSLKVNVDGNTRINTQVSVNEKENFTIWLQNPCYCEEEYWQYTSFIIIDSNNWNTGTLEIYVNGTRKLAYAVTNGYFEEIEDCSNKSRYILPSDILDGYGTYDIEIRFTENGVSETLTSQNVIFAEFAPTTDPKLELYFDLYTLNLPADDFAHIYLPREATGTLTISYNDVKNRSVSYSKGYAKVEMKAWELNHLGENVVTVTYTGDDFGTLTATESVIVVPSITSPSYVGVGEEFTISMMTHEWVNGKFNVYDYTGDVKGKLLASNTIANRVSSVNLSSDVPGLNKYYLEFDYPGGDYPLIHQVIVVKNSENVIVSVPNEVETGSSFNVSINAPAEDFTFLQISVDGGDSDFIMLENGKATKEVSNLSAGHHTVKVFYENVYFADDNFVGDIYLNTFTVNVGVKTSLDASDVVVDYNSTDDLIVTLKDADGRILSGKDVKINLNGEDYIKTTDNNGKAVLTVSLPAGNFKALICFEGSEGYLSSNATSNITVNKLKTQFIACDVNVTAGRYNTLPITLTDSQGIGLADKQVTVSIESPIIEFTDIDGNVPASVYLVEGFYTAFISFNGDDIYEASDAEIKVNAYKIESQISSSNLNITYGDSGKLTVILTDSEGVGLANKSVLLSLGNANSTFTTDENGVANITVSPDAGSFTAKICFEGDNTYIASSCTSQITVDKLATQLTAPQISTKYNVAKNLVITLKDNKGQVLAGKNVIVTLNGKTYTNTTDANGQVRISSYNLAPKKYPANVRFDGDSNYLSSAVDTYVVVAKALPKITASNKAYKAKTKIKKYTITLKNNKNAVLKSKKVTLKVNKKTYYAKTNSKGKATFKITKLTKKGTYKATIKFAGSPCYKSVSKKTKITVKK